MLELKLNRNNEPILFLINVKHISFCSLYDNQLRIYINDNGTLEQNDCILIKQSEYDYPLDSLWQRIKLLMARG